MDIIAKISEELGIKRHQTEAAIPFLLLRVTGRRRPAH